MSYVVRLWAGAAGPDVASDHVEQKHRRLRRVAAVPESPAGAVRIGPPRQLILNGLQNQPGDGGFEGVLAKGVTVNDFVRLIPGLTGETQASLNPRYNIAPSQALLLARNGDEGDREWAALYWGLLPLWAKDPKMRRPINARAETVHEKPFFRTAFKHRRCLIAADGGNAQAATSRITPR